MIDIHCHIVPDVDDGARSLEEAVAMYEEVLALTPDYTLCRTELGAVLQVRKTDRDAVATAFAEVAAYCMGP